MTPFLRRLRARFSYRNLSIRYKLMLALIAVAVLPALTFMGVQTAIRYFRSVENVEGSLQQQAQLTGLVIEHNIEQELDGVFTVVQNVRLRSRSLYTLLSASAQDTLPNTSTVIDAMDAQLDLYPEIKAIRLLDSTGTLLAVAGDIATYPAVANPNQRDNPAFVQIVSLVPTIEQPVLLTPYIDDATQAVTLEAASPLIEGSTLYGYLIFTLDGEEILQATMTAQGDADTPANAFQDAYTYLLDRDGWLLTPVNAIRPLSRQYALEDISTGSDEALQYERNWGQGPVQVTGRYYLMESTGWWVVSEVPMTALGGPLLVENLTAGVPTLLALLLILVPVIVILSRQTVRPIQDLTDAAERIAGGEMDIPLPEVNQLDEIGALNNAFAAMTDQVRASIHGLEQRVAARSRDLTLITEIGREATSFKDVTQLLNTTVDEVVARFENIYHAQVFLNDEAGGFAVLTASTGDVGRNLLRRGHKLAIGSLSVIGRATQLGETVIARDTTTSGVHHKNEYLPETRAEMALPLIYEGDILGAMDVQSKAPDAFAPEEQVLFEALAAQLAIAIYNNRTFTEMQQTVNALNAENRRLTFQSWRQVFGRQDAGVLDVAVGPSGFEEGGDFSAWQYRAIRERDMVISPPDDEGQVALAIPLISSGQVLGVVEWQFPAERMTDATRQLARSLVSRLSITMDTIRLLERTERLAERERLVNQVSGQIAVEPNVPHILQTAVEQLSQILGTSQVNIQLKRANGGAPANGPMESVQ